MCARLLIVTICVIQAYQLHGLKYSGKTSWPYWQGLTAKSFGTANFTVGYNFQEECPIQDRPNPNDKFSAVCTSGLVALTTFLAAAGEGQFPNEYSEGIVISAGPPPAASPSDSPYKQNNWKEWGDNYNDESFAHGALESNLKYYQEGGSITKYAPITGVYEGQKEASFLVGLDEEISWAYTGLGEILRARFYQDSYLWYEKRIQGQSHKCPSSEGAPAQTYYRKFGLGFGRDSQDFGSDGTMELGHLCEYAAPVNEAFPFACSVQGNVMWAQTDKPYKKETAAQSC